MVGEIAFLLNDFRITSKKKLCALRVMAHHQVRLN